VSCSPSGAPIDPSDDREDWRSLLATAGVREARVHAATERIMMLARVGKLPGQEVMDRVRRQGLQPEPAD
jgi:hypothetical protein